MLTRTLLIAIGLLVAAGAWRLVRWYWRPSLALPEGLILERDEEGVRVFLDVRNEGAGRSRGCRAVLLRCEKEEPVGWLRFEPKPDPDAGDPKELKEGILPHHTARVELDRMLPDEPGRYRLEIAVINGEERRSSYVVQIEAVSPAASS